jgi:hypothetical protein
MQQEHNRQREEQQRTRKKPYVWIHPPKDLELNVLDELFVLCDKNPQDLIHGRNDDKIRTNLDLLGGGIVGGGGGKQFKNEDKKIQKDSMNKLL